MKLQTWLSQKSGRQTILALALGAHPPDVSRWASGKRPIPIAYGALIEAATNKEVTRQEMFPDSWEKIWPELAGNNPAGRRASARRHINPALSEKDRVNKNELINSN
jgi:DNA-binding transcriptional regulator YdaS (Cro superfamily)